MKYFIKNNPYPIILTLFFLGLILSTGNVGIINLNLKTILPLAFLIIYLPFRIKIIYQKIKSSALLQSIFLLLLISTLYNIVAFIFNIDILPSQLSKIKYLFLVFKSIVLIIMLVDIAFMQSEKNRQFTLCNKIIASIVIYFGIEIILYLYFYKTPHIISLFQTIKGRYGSFIFQNNALVGFLSCYTFAYGLTVFNKYRKISILILTASSVACILTVERSIIVFQALIMILCLALWLKYRLQNIKYKFILTLTAVTSILASIIFVSSIAMNKMRTHDLMYLDSLYSRTIFNAMGIDTALSYFPWGTGPSTSLYFIANNRRMKYATNSLKNTGSNINIKSINTYYSDLEQKIINLEANQVLTSHSTFIDFFIEYGIAGIILSILYFLFPIHYILKNKKFDSGSIWSSFFIASIIAINLLSYDQFLILIIVTYGIYLNKYHIKNLNSH